jgi:hypothetical protein
MSNKRSNRSKTPKFYCPYCDRRLWREGTGKHSLFFQGANEIQQQFGLTKKKASLLVGQSFVQVDRSTWLEEFFCQVDGKMWLKVSKDLDGTITTQVADQKHWKQSTNTIDPNKPNPSVSEFTYRMSRKSAKI